MQWSDGGGDGWLSVFMTGASTSSEVGDGGGTRGSRSMRAAAAEVSIGTVGEAELVIRSAFRSSHARSATPSAKHEPSTARRMAGDMSDRLAQLGEHPPQLEKDQA